MGENLKKGHCEAFKKGTDRQMLVMSSPQLFRRPDMELTRVDANLLDGKLVSIGDTLLAQQSGDLPMVYLSKGSEPIATIEGEGAAKLVEAIEESDCPDFAEVNVVDVCDISDSITVQLIDEERNHD